jgi:hypothetical protein
MMRAGQCGCDLILQSFAVLLPVKSVGGWVAAQAKTISFLGECKSQNP